ncbi:MULTISPECIES: shikimate kinase [Aneurinibacillus]|uniref:Shikimate kinase n=2 Tax=Aneurinibacillus thermoaerophilus TaxID=143495 RepID=A0A1G7ZN52_ANETH|nr:MULTISPECIES: shikimate kinase [Aneurinibacillus]MED0679951.1 shikimate kinase [Aneurinibacillus thermoaerophilus]MED0735546.1 shikimate kinase [Aneurinibacillus thermoaerophilus]MED0757273.1 shikimate kinase [Aneurinibacillus thermoaerophilus]MED0762063.1 shikimate kinase [Aneurinibacillus thermoaerophilus]MED0763650.1 shikimate kinase [Aneurinibacillus thermoaerophilus]
MTTQIILIGFMGTGKTTVGQAIAKRLGWKQVDVDHCIVEATGKEIRDIFREQGEEGFRALETKMLAQVLNGSIPQVVTTGGGVVTRKQNVELIVRHGLAVALRATPETIVARLHADATRPLLAGDVERNVRRIMQEREGLYDFAPVQLVTDGKSVAQIVDELWAHPAFRRFLTQND